jgi:hypothetical protein
MTALEAAARRLKSHDKAAISLKRMPLRLELHGDAICNRMPYFEA